MAKDIQLESVLYYLIDKANKVARRYTQERFNEAGLEITVDQWLVLKRINDTERITQVALAEALFKDTASITRILDLLITRGLLKKETGEDKRSYELVLTTDGRAMFRKVLPQVKSHRSKGTEGMSEKEVEQLKRSLQKIIDNFS